MQPTLQPSLHSHLTAEGQGRRKISRYKNDLNRLPSEVARILEIDTDTVKRAFPEVGKNFWLRVRRISSACKDWQKVQKVLEQARQFRQKERPSRVSQQVLWTHWDAKKAEEIMDESPTRRGDPAIARSIAVGTNVVQSRYYSRPTTTSPSCESTYTSGPKVHIIFCGVSRYRDLTQEDSAFISIQIDPAYSSYGGQLLERFTREYLCELERTLGRGLVASVAPNTSSQEGNNAGHCNQQQFVVHQNVVAMIAAENTGLVSVELRNMKWVSDMVSKHSFAGHVAAVAADKVIIYAPWDSDHINDKITQDFYTQTHEATAFHKNLHVYPSRNENYTEGHKLIDIAALDRIAEHPETPFEFSFRPRTCYGHGECTMADWSGMMVVKRTFSSGAKHVYVDSYEKSSIWKNLACTGRNHKLKRGKPDRNVTYFHQAYIESLEKFGEIRVMMCGDDIIEVSRTRWVSTLDRPRQILHARAFNPNDDLLWYSSDPAKRAEKYSELKAFCLFYRQALIQSFEAERNFESVHVGLRLDIGISSVDTEGEGFFFINEFPRWWGANWFSNQISPSEPTNIARRFGENFAQVISRS